MFMIFSHLITENHEQHDDIWIVEVAEIICGVATERVKYGLHSLSAFSSKTLQLTLPRARVGRTFAQIF